MWVHVSSNMHRLWVFKDILNIKQMIFAWLYLLQCNNRLHVYKMNLYIISYRVNTTFSCHWYTLRRNVAITVIHCWDFVTFNNNVTPFSDSSWNTLNILKSYKFCIPFGRGNYSYKDIYHGVISFKHTS